MGVLRAALREVKALFRSRETLFWVVAWPVMLILITAYVFIPSPGSLSLDVAVVDLDRGVPHGALPTNFSGLLKPRNFTDALVKALRSYAEEKGVGLRLVVLGNASCSYPCAPLAEELVRDRGFEVVVVVPPNASLGFSTWIPVNLSIYVRGGGSSEEYLYLGLVTPVITNLSVSKSIERVEASLAMMRRFVNASALRGFEKYIRLGLYGTVFPIVPRIEVVKPRAVVDRAGVLGFVTIGGVGYVVLVASLSSSVGILAYRKENGTLRRILATPTRFRDLVAIELVSSILFQLASSAVVVAVGLAIGARILFNPLDPGHWVAVAALLVAMVFTFLTGLLLAPLARSGRGASAISIPLALTLMFTTGIWWPPKEMLPPLLRTFADVFPPSLAFDVIRDTLVWNRPWAAAAPKIVVMLAGLAVVALATAALYSRRFEEVAYRVLKS